MAKRKETDASASETEANREAAPEQGQTELPMIEAPSVSPAKTETESEPTAGEATSSASFVTEMASKANEKTEQTSAATTTAATVAWPRLKLRPRHKRYAVLAASVVIAGALGVVIGATAIGGFARPAPVNVAGLEDSKIAQQSIVRLQKEIASLKASLEAANKSAHSQFAKISERLARGNAEVTAAITPPQTVPITSQVSTPLPPSRPAPAEATLRPTIIADWTIRETRDGFVYVQGHGDIYQVVLGAPLPGIGPVEQIKRQDGRWVVVTPKGIIVSMRDRRYFEQF